MRSFILRARQSSTRWDRLKAQVGQRGHSEIIAHSVINAFFLSSAFREDVELYVVLESTEDFPRTIKLSANQGLSIEGFHEDAVLDLLATALKKSQGLQRDETRAIAPGLEISGFGFDRLVGDLLKDRPVYLLDHKGENIGTLAIAPNPVFVLSDHLAMPKKSITGLKRKGLQFVSLGKQVLFASHCVVILHYELDKLGNE